MKTRANNIRVEQIPVRKQTAGQYLFRPFFVLFFGPEEMGERNPGRNNPGRKHPCLQEVLDFLHPEEEQTPEDETPDTLIDCPFDNDSDCDDSAVDDGASPPPALTASEQSRIPRDEHGFPDFRQLTSSAGVLPRGVASHTPVPADFDLNDGIEIIGVVCRCFNCVRPVDVDAAEATDATAHTGAAKHADITATQQSSRPQPPRQAVAPVAGQAVFAAAQSIDAATLATKQSIVQSIGAPPAERRLRVHASNSSIDESQLPVPPSGIGGQRKSTAAIKSVMRKPAAKKAAGAAKKAAGKKKTKKVSKAPTCTGVESCVCLCRPFRLVRRLDLKKLVKKNSRYILDKNLTYVANITQAKCKEHYPEIATELHGLLQSCETTCKLEATKWLNAMSKTILTGCRP